VRVVCISDTHGLHEQVTLPPGDLLVHAGDVSRRGTREQVRTFLEWFASRPHPHKLLVAGNHDFLFQKDPAAARALVPPGVTYLEDEAATVAGLRVWGSPWTPEFFDWAFMLERGAPLAARWAAIPDGLDLLITHGPPYGHGDQAVPLGGVSGDARAVGCIELLQAVRRARPRVHVFGHIHEGHGVTVSDEARGTRFVNAAICTVDYRPVNPPLVVDL